MIVLIASAAALWLLGALLLGRTGTLRPARAANVPRISVIIPVRDEAQSLSALLDSLAGQTLAPHEVLVADGGSNDGTGAVALSWGAAVIPVHDRPAGWRGKPWACWTAAQHASGALLVFLDADTRLAPDALQRIADAHAGGLLSVEPYREVPTAREQSAAFLTLLRAASVRTFSIAGHGKPPAGAFGPCVAVSRSEYFEHSGHANFEVRGAALAHYRMGQVFARDGLPVDCYAGRGCVTARKAPGGLRQLIAGFSERVAAYARGMSRLPLWLCLAWIAGALQAALALLVALPMALGGGPPVGLALIAAAVYGAYALQIGLLLRRLGSFSWLSALLYPLPLLAFLAMLARSARPDPALTGSG